MNRTNFDFISLISQVRQVLLPLAARKNIELKSFDHNGSEYIVNADYDRMAQVLINLILQSIEFSSQYSQVDVEINCGGSELTVKIHDSSCDLDYQKIHKIVHNSDWIKQQFNEGKEDVALGLRIAKEFIEMHGGRIWTESSEIGTRKTNNERQITEMSVLCFTVPKFTVKREEAIEQQLSLEKIASENII